MQRVLLILIQVILPVVGGGALAPGQCGLLAQTSSGTIEIDFREKENDELLACRVKIVDSSGRELPVRGGLYQQGWSLVEETLRYRGRVGDYRYQVFHGPEFATAAGGFTLDRKSEAVDVVRLPRHADMTKEGWFAGDLLNWVPAKETHRWLPAEGLTLAVVAADSLPPSPATQPPATQPPATSGSADGDQWRTGWVQQQTYCDSRPGSGLLLHHWWPPAPVPEHLPSSRLIVMAKQAATEVDAIPVHVEIQRLWARDVPIWLASERVDSVQLLSDHLTYDGTRTTPVDPVISPEPGRFRGPQAPGRLVENIYWKLLETGLRIPPTAGSGFGRNSSPLGYNRVYAHVLSPTPSAWWRAVRAGQTFVTNGPLLRATVNGEVPGTVFSIPSGQTLDIDTALRLTVADPVEYLDVVFNGQTLYRARLDEFAKQAGKIPVQRIRESGWLVIRVVTEENRSYRMATTAPFYFEAGNQPRVSRAAVAFFQEWLAASAAQIRALDRPTADAAEPYVRAAEEFWQHRAAAGTVD